MNVDWIHIPGQKHCEHHNGEEYVCFSTVLQEVNSGHSGAFPLSQYICVPALLGKYLI